MSAIAKRPRTDRQLLATKAGKETLARIDSSVGEFVAASFDREAHVLHVALICLRARAVTA